MATASTRPFSFWHLAFQASLPYPNLINSVVATSSTDIWAVGSGGKHFYAVHWNGRRWRMLAFPFPDFRAATVRASSKSNVWFFGDSGAPDFTKEALRWDGASWHVIATPSASATSVVLGPSDAWLWGGEKWTQAHGWRTTIWRWNGLAWQDYVIPAVTDEVSIAGSSDRNLWAVGTTSTSSDIYGGVGRLAAYSWTGSAWRRMATPSVLMKGPPAITVSGSGELWISGRGTRRVHGESIILNRVRGKWTRIDDRRLLLTPPRVNYPPVADGLNGIWFGTHEYWVGHGIVFGRVQARICPGGIISASYGNFMAGIPGTHSAIWTAGCSRTLSSRLQGIVMISRRS